MATNHNATVARNDAIIAELEQSGRKPPDYPLSNRYTAHFTPKFGGRKRKESNSGKVGAPARRKRRAYLGTGSGPQWPGPARK